MPLPLYFGYVRRTIMSGSAERIRNETAFLKGMKYWNVLKKLAE